MTDEQARHEARDEEVPVPAEREPLDGLRAVAPAEDVDDELADVEAAAPDEDDGQPDWESLAADDPRSRGELLAELSEAESRRDEYLDDVRRARAEFENYRKRMLREAQQMRASGVAELAGRLLDVLDDFDRTVDAAEESQDEGLRRGVELVYGKLVDVLRGAGLSRIDSADVPFDPERHEAVQQVEADEPVDEPVVAEVLRPGYEIGGRVIRAAMVAVKQ